jgi:thioredoxin 1
VTVEAAERECVIMTKGSITNVIAILGVVVVVAGAAWLKSQRAETPADDTTQSAESAQVVTTAQPEAGDAGRSAGPEAVSAEPLASPELANTEAMVTGELVVETPDAGPEPAALVEDRPVEPAAAEKLPRLVDLGADKCIPCKKLAPILQELRKEYQGKLSVEFIDVWKNPAAGQPYNIRLIPTQILYDRDGNEVWRHEGFISKADLKALFAEKVGVK